MLCQGIWIQTVPHKSREGHGKEIFETADAIVINTPFMRDNSVGDNPDLKDKFHVIPNGFDKRILKGLNHAGRTNGLHSPIQA